MIRDMEGAVDLSCVREVDKKNLPLKKEILIKRLFAYYLPSIPCLVYKIHLIL